MRDDALEVAIAERRGRGIGGIHVAGLGRGLDIEGSEADGVLKAIEFLINMNRGFEVAIGERVLVIGGGDVAMDAARTALRAGDYVDARSSEALAERSAMTEAFDVARTAARAGAKEITIMSLESREEMPAHDLEVEEAEVEGITFVNRRGPQAITVHDGRATGVQTIGVLSVFDEEGRFSPVFDAEDIRHIEADTVILAIGQAIDIECLGDGSPEISPRRTILVDDDTGATSLPGVWAGGDAAKGPRTLIDAIADGRRSAAAIDRSFGGAAVDAASGTMVELNRFHRLDDSYDYQQRVEVPMLDTGRRMGLAEVELGFTAEQARCEANRCLRCFSNILLDVQACVLCALCADVCPVDVISLVPAAELAPEGVSVPVGTESTALLLDETACIRCGLCIERCPPKALSMGVWSGVGVPA